jgi:hypothetical protein
MEFSKKRGGFTRRALLKSGCASAVALAVPGAAWAAASQSYLKRSSYLPLVGQTFTVLGSGVSLQLTAVQDIAGAPAGSNDAFALIFGAAPGARAIKAVPTLSQPSLGSFQLLLAPGQASSAGASYSAIINRTVA